MAYALVMKYYRYHYIVIPPSVYKSTTNLICSSVLKEHTNAAKKFATFCINDAGMNNVSHM